MRSGARVMAYCWQVRLESLFIFWVPWGTFGTRKVRERVLPFFSNLYALAISSGAWNIHFNHKVCIFSRIRSAPLEFEPTSIRAYGFGFLIIRAWSWNIRVIHVFVLRVVDFLIVFSTDAYTVQTPFSHCCWSPGSPDVKIRSEVILSRIWGL